MSDTRLDGTIEPEEARLKLAKKEAAVIDLRDPEQVGESRVPGAVWVENDDPVAAAEQARADRDLPVLVVGDDEEQCRKAVETLNEADIEAAAIEGGWEAWVSDGQPVQPKEEVIKGPDLSKVPGS